MKKAPLSSSQSEDKNSSIVRVAGHGQFKVNKATLNKINHIDDQIADILEDDEVNENEFRKKIKEMVNLITKEGKPLDHKELIESHIIVPSTDLSLDEAKKIFKGEGIIPQG